MFGTKPPAPATEALSSWVYELLDAHDDTARLAGELVLDERWRSHVDYLRSLQRVGREALAHALGGQA